MRCMPKMMTANVVGRSGGVNGSKGFGESVVPANLWQVSRKQKSIGREVWPDVHVYLK